MSERSAENRGDERRRPTTPSVALLGIGNVLMGDDGLGPYVVKRLEAAYRFPPELRLVEIGTPGLDLIPYLTGLELLIVVDTVYADVPPGTLRRYGKEAILEHVPRARVGPHDPTLKEALLTADFAGECPREVVLLGMVPESSKPGVGLSPTVSAALPDLELTLLAELASRGLKAVPKETPTEPEIWWERKGVMP